ncbi:MAG TPA: hypothetical protein PK438_00905, partial [Clostridia bacterium]|nr:hypothetical protein [Clostridia bacterium]
GARAQPPALHAVLQQGKLCLFGQEGVTATRLTDIERAPEEVRRFYLDLSLKLCDKRAYAAYSSHMMYVGRKLTDDQW